MMIKTVKHYVVASKRNYTNEVEFVLREYEPSSSHLEAGEFNIVIGEMNIDISIPDDFDPRPKQIDALEAQRKKATADYHALMNVIDGKIQQLKCIEHRPE